MQVEGGKQRDARAVRQRRRWNSLENVVAKKMGSEDLMRKAATWLGETGFLEGCLRRPGLATAVACKNRKSPTNQHRRSYRLRRSQELELSEKPHLTGGSAVLQTRREESTVGCSL